MDAPQPDAGHTHLVYNGKRELTIDELALMQPGMDRLMAEVGPRMHRLYYAAQAGNWRLAEYFFKSVVKQLKLCGTSRPKYVPQIEAYLAEDTDPVKRAIKDRDKDKFDAAYHQMVDRANFYHDYFGKPFICWKTPDRPPDDLDLSVGIDE